MPAALAQSPTPAQTTAYNEAYAVWNTIDNKAIGAITLHITACLRHYRGANDTSRTFWMNLKTAFGTASMPAVYVDFKQVINIKLTGGNPIPDMERMATLFGRLTTNSLTLPDNLQALLSLPPRWDSIAQLYLQHTDLATTLTFANV